MNILREYVNTLSDEDKIRIIDGHEELENTGVIGDEPIREHVKLFFAKHNIEHGSTVMWMQMLAFECHRYFSMRYITEVYY